MSKLIQACEQAYLPKAERQAGYTLAWETAKAAHELQLTTEQPSALPDIREYVIPVPGSKFILKAMVFQLRRPVYAVTHP